MMTLRPVAPRARRSALIVASVPDDTARTFSIDGTAARTASANSTSSAVGAPKLVPWTSVRLIASRISGWAWPRIIGPHEPTRSRYS
jgi:hypothetical protein